MSTEANLWFIVTTDSLRAGKAVRLAYRISVKNKLKMRSYAHGFTYCVEVFLQLHVKCVFLLKKLLS